ncbi:NmrA family NAD(P)-binding protein [Paenibacillus farraposensis]|uniref:NmrA family NAD(P)-binding protein n=1 Tax=Paenibacillus farraposensis TaxID=2807095 RepID=A0ABW4D8E6_9BACL|nr:NmrA family NAD(P)-binding protein [Paenibacillus farraposensis]MCC3381658.1 NmrA family NAD(P)-binding protein [Paenibacillus farraposensis]
MYTVMGVTGQVGGATARHLLKEELPVKVVLRDERKAQEWINLGAKIAIADYRDTAALQTAFADAEAVFVMIPPSFYPDEEFSDTCAYVEAIRLALSAAQPSRFVALSSIGAQHTEGTGIIHSLHILEEQLKRVAIPSAFLRAAWFMENAAWDIGPAREQGRIQSFLTPLNRLIPMISTNDIGAIAAATLQQVWEGIRYLELQGPQPYSPNDIASVLTKLLDRRVEIEVVPRSEWAEIFIGQGGIAANVQGRLEMLDGFNSGWIDFKRKGTEIVTGQVSLEEALKSTFKLDKIQ